MAPAWRASVCGSSGGLIRGLVSLSAGEVSGLLTAAIRR